MAQNRSVWHTKTNAGSLLHSGGLYSLLCGPISPVVTQEMSSTARFCVEMQYMVAQDYETADAIFLSISFSVIDLISMLVS